MRTRVCEEVVRHDARSPGLFNGLVRPVDAEEGLNGYRLRTPRRLDWEQQADVAEEPFRRARFFVLVGDRRSRTVQLK